MIAILASLSAIGRAHTAPYERIAWFMLRNLEREHQLNLHALADSQGRVGKASVQRVTRPLARVGGSASSNVLEQWARTMQTLSCLGPAFIHYETLRLADVYRVR